MALVNEWITYYQAGGRADGTMRVREAQIRRLARYVDLLKATTDDLISFLANLTTGAWSRTGYRAAMRSFFEWLQETGRRQDNPAARLPRVRTPRGVPRPAPVDVIEHAIKVADDQTRFMLLLGAYAGLRRNEIATLHSRNVTADHLVITGKNGTTRRIPIHPRLRPYLNFDGWAFPSKKAGGGFHLNADTVSRHMKQALGGLTPHTLRHSAATRWYGASHDIRAVQQLLGHASPTTTAIYAAVGDDEMRSAVLAIP